MTNIPSQATDREHPDVRYRRLLFRSWHRGTQESDLILGSFAEESLKMLDSDQLGRFEALLDCTDPDLFDWIFGVSDPPPEHDHDVMRLLRGFCTERHLGPQRSGQFESDAPARATSCAWQGFDYPLDGALSARLHPDRRSPLQASGSSGVRLVAEMFAEGFECNG